MRAKGLDHLDVFDEHVALRELVGFAGGLLHDNAVCAGISVRWQLADGHFAGARLHVAKDAEAVVPAQDVFFGEVAMELEAVEAEACAVRTSFSASSWMGNMPLSPQ